MGKDTEVVGPVVIEIDKNDKKKDIDKLDIEIPKLSRRFARNFKRLEDLDIKTIATSKVAYKTYTEEELRELFDPFGYISEIHLPINIEKKSKGFGFIQFLIPENANNALNEFNNKPFQGRILHITKAKNPVVKDSNNISNTNKKLSSFQQKKEEERKKNSNIKEGWNSSYIRSDAVVDSLADRFKYNPTIYIYHINIVVQHLKLYHSQMFQLLYKTKYRHLYLVYNNYLKIDLHTSLERYFSVESLNYYNHMENLNYILH
jgi:RNA recognition motif-containing protein